MQRAEVVATGDRPVGRVSGGAGLVVEPADDGVEGGVDVVDAGEVGLDHLPGRHLPGPHGGGELERAALPQQRLRHGGRLYGAPVGVLTARWDRGGERHAASLGTCRGWGRFRWRHSL